MARGEGETGGAHREGLAAFVETGELLRSDTREVTAEDRPIAEYLSGSSGREVTARRRHGRLRPHDEPSGSPEPENEIEVVADRQIPEPAGSVVGVPAAEDPLVAVGQPRETGSLIRPPRNPAHPRARAFVLQGKGSGGRAARDRPPDDLQAVGGWSGIRVHEEEDVAARLLRRGRETCSPRSPRRQDPSADAAEGVPRGVRVAPVGDQELTGGVEAEAGEVPGDVGGLVAGRDDDGSERELLRASDASIGGTVKFPMPAAVLAGGASKRMGRPKAALPWGAGNLLEFQTGRLAALFREVIVVVKRPPDFPVGPARVVFDTSPEYAAIHGLARALEETEDRMFVLAVDLPGLTHDIVHEIATRGLKTPAPALVPEAGGRLQPLAAVWRRSTIRFASRRIARGMLSLTALVEEVGAEILPERDWRVLDPSGNAFANLNTLEDWAAHRERA